MTLTIGHVEEVARERCSCGEYQYAPKTWKAIKDVGITAHLPRRLGGCQLPETELSKTVQQGATAMDEKVAAATPAPPAPKEEKPVEAAAEAAAESVPAMEGNGATTHRRPGLERYTVTTGEGTRAIWMADGKVRAVEFAWAARVSYGTVATALERLGEKKLRDWWPLRVGKARKMIGKPTHILTRQQAEAVLKEIASLEAGFRPGVTGRKIHSRNKNRGEGRLAVSYVVGSPESASKSPRRTRRLPTAPDQWPRRSAPVARAGEPIIPVYGGYVPYSQFFVAAMRRRPGAKDRARVEKAYGTEAFKFVPGHTARGHSRVLGLTRGVAEQMNESPTSPFWRKVTLRDQAVPPRAPYEPKPEKPRQKAAEPAGRAQPPPPSVEVEQLQRIILRRPAALREALEAAGVKRMSYEKGGRFTMSLEISL